MPFHFTNSLLDVGSVILPGNFGRIIRAAGYSHSHALRESVLEDMRARLFPDLPSRLESAFYFDAIGRVRAYHRTQGLSHVNWYEVSRVDPSAIEARADFRRVDPQGAIGLHWAEAYWQGYPWPFQDNIDPEENFIETFSVTALRIVRRISETELYNQE